MGKHPRVSWEAMYFWNLQYGDPKDNDASLSALTGGLMWTEA